MACVATYQNSRLCRPSIYASQEVVTGDIHVPLVCWRDYSVSPRRELSMGPTYFWSAYDGSGVQRLLTARYRPVRPRVDEAEEYQEGDDYLQE